MSSLTTRETLQMFEKTEFAITSTTTQKATVTAELTEALGGDLTAPDGTTVAMPDWDAVQTYHAALLERSAEEVRKADQDHRLNRVNVSQVRQKRRQLAGGLKRRHRDLRKSFTGTYGEEALPLVGLDAPPAKAFLAIREQQLETVERMRDPELASQLPEPRSGQEALNLVTLADRAEKGVRDFEAAGEEIQRMRKVLDESLIARKEAQKRHRRLYLNVVRIQEGYYRLAGLDELADRIRGGGRKKSPGAEPPNPAEPTETQPPQPTEEPTEGSPNDPETP